jgi:hypothetical protein
MAILVGRNHPDRATVIRPLLWEHDAYMLCESAMPPVPRER